MPLYYSIGLLLLFVVLLVVEFFIPTAGMMGVAAAITAVVAIFIAFTHSVFAGAAITLSVLITTPVILVTMVRVWPNTIIGRMILNRRPGEENKSVGHRTKDGKPVGMLDGKLGIAKTDLLPAGQIVVDGQKLDAVSIGTPIDAGTHVIVVKTSAGKIRVRAALDSEIASRTDPIGQIDGDGLDQPVAATESAPPLDQPSKTKTQSVLESIDLDSLD